MQSAFGEIRINDGVAMLTTIEKQVDALVEAIEERGDPALLHDARNLHATVLAAIRLSSKPKPVAQQDIAFLPGPPCKEPTSD